MPIPVSLLFLLFAFCELAAFLFVGGMIGAAPTLGLALLAVVAGVVILRRQSIATVMRARSEMAAGRTPAGPVVDGALVGAGAILLVVPGFLSDLAGLALLVPLTRRAIRSWLSRRFATRPEGARRRRGAVLELKGDEYISRPPSSTAWHGPDQHGRAEGD